jgi:hypothetical protein
VVDANDSQVGELFNLKSEGFPEEPKDVQNAMASRARAASLCVVFEVQFFVGISVISASKEDYPTQLTVLNGVNVFPALAIVLMKGQ